MLAVATQVTATVSTESPELSTLPLPLTTRQSSPTGWVRTVTAYTPSSLTRVAKAKLPLPVKLRLSLPLSCSVRLRPAPRPLSEPPIVAWSVPPQAASRAARAATPRPALTRHLRPALVARTAAAARTRPAQQQGGQQRGRRRTGGPRRRREQLRQAVDRIDADLLDVVDQGDHVASVHALEIVGPDMEVLPAAAQAKPREQAAGDGEQRQYAERPKQLVEDAAALLKRCVLVDRADQPRERLVGRGLAGGGIGKGRPRLHRSTGRTRIVRRK